MKKFKRPTKYDAEESSLNTITTDSLTEPKPMLNLELNLSDCILLKGILKIADKSGYVKELQDRIDYLYKKIDKLTEEE